MLFFDSEDKMNIRSQLEEYNWLESKPLIQTGYLALWRASFSFCLFVCLFLRRASFSRMVY